MKIQIVLHSSENIDQDLDLEETLQESTDPQDLAISTEDLLAVSEELGNGLPNLDSLVVTEHSVIGKELPTEKPDMNLPIINENFGTVAAASFKIPENFEVNEENLEALYWEWLTKTTASPENELTIFKDAIRAALVDTSKMFKLK